MMKYTNTGIDYMLRQQEEEWERMRREQEAMQAEQNQRTEEAIAAAQEAEAEAAQRTQEGIELAQQGAEAGQAASQVAAAEASASTHAESENETEAEEAEAPEPEPAVKDGKASIGPTNRPFTEEQSFALHQRHAINDTKTRVVKRGELGDLGALEPHREMFEEKHKKGELMPSAFHDWGTSRIEIDFSSIKSNDQAAYFATTLDSDSDKHKFFREYADRTNQNYYTILNEAESKLGGRLFATPQTQMAKIKTYNQGLANQGLMDVDGNMLNMATATQPQIEQAIRLEPDPDNRKNAIAYYGKLCEARGWTYNKDSLGFMDSADMTQKDYNAAVSEYNELFSIGFSEENWNAYDAALEEISTDYTNPRIQKQMEAALKKSYEARTGRIAPTADEIRAAKEQFAADEQLAGDDNESLSLWDRLMKRFDKWDETSPKVFEFWENVFNKGEAEKPKEDPLIAEEESAEGEAPKQQPIMAGGTVSMGGQTMNVSRPIASAGAMPPKSEMFDVDAISSPSILNVLPGEQQEEPAQQTGMEPEASEAKPQHIREVPYDPNMTDEQALAEYKKGGTLDPRNREQIAWYVDDKVASGVSYGLNPKDVNWGTGDDIYDTTQYWQYGKSIGSAAKVLNSGILTDDMQNSAELALGKVIKTIREDVANPEKGISVPANQNMMEYVLNLPQYSGLKNTVQSINDAQKQIIEINAENEIKAKEERKQEVQTAIETLKAGLGTPDLLDFVKGEFDSTKVDFNSDETYQQYKHQLSYRSNYFFDDNGAFWNGDSAAAAEGKNLRTLGEGYGEFKSALKMQTEQLLEDYTVSAMSMGMTLDELLGSMGIDSVDQVIDIAYNNMQTVGNKFASDVVAQETAQAVAENPQSIGYVKAGAAGGLLAFKSTNKGILETAYMTVSDATYKQNVQDLRNDFRAQYGEAAPHMYYSAIMAKIDSGELSQQAAAELFSDMNRVDDIFELGYVLDDGFLETLLRNPADSLQKDIEEIGDIIDKLPENEKKVANAFSMLVSTGYGMALSTSVGMVAGAPVLGSAVAYGMPAYSDTRRDMKMKGATKGTGHWFALANAAATTALNTGTTGAQAEIWGDLSWMTMQKKLGGKGGAELWRQIGTFVKNQAASEGLEEVNETIKDVAFDAASKAVIAYEKGEVPRLSDAFGLVIDNVSSLDMADTGMEVLKSYGAGFLMGGIMTLGGVATSGIVTGAKMSRNYESIKMSAQMVNGEIPFTEENVGKVYELVQKDLQNPEYCRWIDKANATAREQNNMVTAAMMGVGNDARQAAVKHAARANDYRQKEASAKDAAETATKRWVELRQQVMDGNLDMVPMMTTAQQQMAKAHTTHIESGKAADKAEADAAQSVREWLAACGAYKSESMKFFANRAIVQRQLLAEELQAKYEAEEAAKIEEEKRRDAETSREVAYAEGAVFAEDDADMAESEEETLDTMSDEDLDREIETLGAQIVDAEARVADATARREELGLDGETIQQLVDQELTPLSSRKEKIIAKESKRFDDLFGRIQQALEMDNEDAADQLQAEYNAVANRLIGLGADVDSLVMKQYGITPEQLETAQEAEQPAPVEDETERLTYSLARRMEETNTGLETINSARRYLASTPIYVNESQAADILSEEGLKSISQVNRRYGTKLTTDAGKGAMPLDGHVLTDINDEMPGVVDVEADPVGEALRILRSGKELTARQKSEKLEAKELNEQIKKKKADAKAARVERAYEVTGTGNKPERQAKQINQVVEDESSTVEDIDRTIDRIEGVSMSMADEPASAETSEPASEEMSNKFSDPVMQKLERDLYKNWGIRLRTADLDPRDEGFYDRESNTIVLNKRLTSGEKQRTVVMHELIHFCEGQAWYPQFKKDILAGAYSGEAEIEENRQRLRDMGYGENELDFELVAHAAKPLFEGDELLIGNLLSNGKVPAIKRAYAAVSQYLARRKAKKMGMGKQYEALESARKMLAQGLKDARATQGIDARHMYVGQSPDGKAIYESNFPSGTSKADKQKRLINLWQNVWSQKPIELNIKEDDGSVRSIIASFDPDYDPTNVKKTDLGKVMSNKNGSGGDRNVTLNLADDLYDLARTSVYMVSEDEHGKNTSTHQDVKRWHYFFNDIIYRGNNGDVPYTVWLDVKEKSDGGYVYQLYAKKTKKGVPATASNAHQNPLAGISQSAGQVGTVPQGLGTNAAGTPISNTNIPQNGTGVNSQSMQNRASHSYSDMTLSQYGNETAQEIDWINQAVKDQLKGSMHEVRTDRSMITETMQRIEDMGGTEEALNDLMSRPPERWNADDHAMAQVLMAKAEYDGDITTEAMVAMIYDRAGSEAGLVLQKRKLLSRMNAQTALALAAKLSSKHNMKNGGSSQYAPVGNGKPLVKTGENDPAGKIIDRAKRLNNAILKERGMDDIVERENRWGIPLTGAQMYLIDHYKLSKTDLPGIHYNQATLKQRMLSAILAMDTDVVYDVDMDGNRNGLLGLIQQLEAMKNGKAVQTIADLTYIANQMAEMKAQSNGSEDPYLNTKEAQQALARAYDAINNVVPVTLSQKLSALAYMNMLSASTTGVKNVLGNVVMGSMEAASEAIATGIDKVVFGKTGNRTTTISSSAEVAKGLREGLAEAAQTIADTYVYQADTSQSRRYDVSGDAPRVFQNRLMEGKRRFVDMVMQLGDRPFFRAEYSRQLDMIKRLSAEGKMKKKDVTTTEDGRQVVSYSEMTEADMHKEAAQRALERVFQEDSAIANWVNRAHANLRPFLQAVIPFVKTPTNIAKRMLDYTPVGLAKTLLENGIRAAKHDGSFDQRRFVMGVGRGLTGTGMIMAGALLSSLGALDIGDGYGEEDDSALYGAGMANYDPYGKHLIIDGNKVSVDWLGAAGIWMTIGAAAAKEWDNEDMGLGEKMYTVMLKSKPEILNLLFDNTMLSSASALLGGAEDGEDFGTNILNKVVGPMLQQYFSPADIRQFAKFTDEYERDYRDDNPVIEVINKNVIRYWPVLRQTLPIKYDMTGDPVRQSSKYGWGREDENAVLNFMNMYMSPTNIQSDKGDKALDELIDLSYRLGDTGCIPKNLITTSGKVTIPSAIAKKARMDTASGENKLVLTADEQRRYNQMYASLCFNGTEKGRKYEKVGVGSYGSMTGIRDLIDSRSYERMDEKTREEKISEIMKQAKEMVMAQIVIDRGLGR